MSRRELGHCACIKRNSNMEFKTREKTLHMCFDKLTDDNQSNRNILHHYHVHFHKIDHEVLISIQQNNPPRPEQIVHGLLRYTKRIKF